MVLSIVYAIRRLIKLYLIITYRDIHDYEMNVVNGISNEPSIDNEDQPGEYLVVRESLKSNLPQTLVIKSANLRVLDLIGQGFSLYSVSH